jgi:hypothetical protein
MAKTSTTFQSGNKAGVGHGRPKGSGNALRQLARRDEAYAYDVIVQTLDDPKAPPHVRLAAAEIIVTWARGKPGRAPCQHDAIEGLDLSTEEGSIDAIRSITVAAIEARIPSDHAHRLMQLVSANIQACRTRIEGQFAVAFAQMQAVMEGRQSANSIASERAPGAKA